MHSEYKETKTESLGVKLESVGPTLVFKSGDHCVTMHWTCDCRFFALHGAKKTAICSHILAVLRRVSNDELRK